MSVKREELARTRRADEQEAEAGVGKLLCSFVDDGLESELLEEYGERWTSHTAAYDDDFGHICVFKFTRTDPDLGDRRCGARGTFLRRGRGGGGAEQCRILSERASSLGPDIVGGVAALRLYSKIVLTVSADAPQ